MSLHKSSEIMMLKLEVKFYTAQVCIELYLLQEQLPIAPLAVFNINNTHWVCMLPLSPSVCAHMPIPLTRILAE